MNKKFDIYDIYKDEFGNYHEIEEDEETPVDGFEDDEQDHYEDDDDDSNDPFDSLEDEDAFYDEDEEYANERSGNEYDIDDD